VVREVREVRIVKVKVGKVAAVGTTAVVVRTKVTRSQLQASTNLTNVPPSLTQ